MKKKFASILLAMVLSVTANPAGVLGAEYTEETLFSEAQEAASDQEDPEISAEETESESSQDITADNADVEISEADVSDSGTSDEISEFSDGSQNETDILPGENRDDRTLVASGRETSSSVTTTWTNIYINWEFYNDGLLKIDYGSRIGTINWTGGTYVPGCPWKNYKEQVTRIEITGGNEIGNDIFYGYPNLTSLKIGEGTTIIGNNAFAGNTKLREVSLPDSLRALNRSAFGGCTSLEEIAISAQTSLMHNCFNNCKSLKKVTFAPGYVGNGDEYGHGLVQGVFMGCEALEEITIPASMDYLSADVFSGCKSLKKVAFEEGSEKNTISIGEGCFRECSSLEEIQMPQSSVSVDGDAFSKCTSLKSAAFNKVTNIGQSAFADCTSLESVTFTEAPETVYAYAFSNCMNLKEMNFTSLEEQTLDLQEKAFERCRSLSKVTFGDNLKVSIGKRAFDGTGKLSTIDGTENVDSIEEYAFSGSGIEKFYFGNEITEIKDNAFAGSLLKEIRLSESITSIGNNAFDTPESDRKMSTIRIPASVKTIGSEAFADWDFSEIEICGATEIERHAFGKGNTWADGTQVIILAKDVKHIDDEAFASSKKKIVQYRGSQEDWQRLGFNGAVDEIYYNYNSDHQHEYTEKVIEPAYCEAAGEKELTCRLCGYTYRDIIPAKGHTPEAERRDVAAATCEYQGYSGDLYCKDCGNLMEKGEYTQTLPHQLVTEPEKPATCEEDGTTSWAWCKVCKRTVISFEIIPATGHKEKILPATKATCEEWGLSQGSICTVCGEILDERYETYPPTGHKYDAKWNTRNVTSESLVQYKKCKNCGKEQTRKYTAHPSLKRLTMNPKQTNSKIRVTLTPGDYITKWKSSNSSIVRISQTTEKSCVLRSGTKTGKVRISYTTKSGISNSIEVTVQKKAVKTQKISGIAKRKTLKKGKSFTLKPVLTPRKSTEKVTYKSSNTKVATVSSKGVVKAKKKGTAVIAVKSGSKSVKCKVTVK